MKTKLFGVVIVSLVLALIFAPALLAQNTTAAVRGAVTDAQGNVIVGAQVTLTNVDTGDSRTQPSDKDGNYDFESIPLGRYKLSVTHDNFENFEEGGIIVHVNDNLTFNAQMKVGAKTETVEVTASANQVELNNAVLSGTVSGTQINQLPLNGRSFAALITLVPGVERDNGFSSTEKGLNGGSDLSVSGGASNSNLWLLDGAINNDVGSNRTILIYPSLDDIEEFKVDRNSYSAQFGSASGGIITVVTKSGTNDFHGSAFYFGRNDAFDATDNSLKFGSSGPVKKDELRQNQYGGSVGGPIMKDKIFFFVSEEWNRRLQGAVSSAHVPTPLQLTGDFSDQALDPNFQSSSSSGCLPLGGLRDPTGGSLGFTDSSRTPGVVDVIPSADLSPAGVAIESTYLKPTLAAGAPNYGCGTNFAVSRRTPTLFRDDEWRGDIHLAKTVTLMLKWSNNTWSTGPYSYGLQAWGNDAGASNIQDQWSQPSRIAVGRLSKIIGADAVNDFQFSYSTNTINVTQTNPGAVTALNADIPTFFPHTGNQAPVWISGGGLPTIWSFAPWNNDEFLYAFGDDFSKVKGRHTLSIGFTMSFNQKNQDSQPALPGVSFGPQTYNGCPNNTETGCTNLTTFLNTGFGSADYLLKNMSVSWSEVSENFRILDRWQNYEGYFNDSIKATDRVTFNLGLRYSYFPNITQAGNQFTLWNPTAYNAALGATACNGLVYAPGLGSNPCPAGTGGIPGPNDALQNNFYLGFAPRLGVAWDPTGDGKTAIRGGFGIFFNRDDALQPANPGGNPPFVASYSSISGNGRYLDSTAQLPPCTPNCFSSGLGLPAYGQSFSSAAPYTMQWNVTVQHQFWKGSVLEASYVGNEDRNWVTNYSANAIIPSDRLAFAQDSGDSAANALRPYTALTNGGLGQVAHNGYGRYNALQAQFTAHFQRGSIVQIAYTYAKTESNTELIVNNSNGGGGAGGGPSAGLLDPFNPSASFGPDGEDRPQIFTANIVYNLWTLQNSERFVRGALGSWEVSSIINVTTGTPLTQGEGAPNISDVAGIGAGAGRPDVVAGQPCRASTLGPSLQYLNPNRYTVNGISLGTVGNEPIGDCFGPGVNQVAFSLSKNFHFRERYQLQFRIDAFNLFNHAQFNNPGGFGYNAVDNAGSPEFLDAAGVGVLTPNNSVPALNAVSIQNTTVAPGGGRTSYAGGQNREMQYSLRFTF